jgi:hypothetical protein
MVRERHNRLGRNVSFGDVKMWPSTNQPDCIAVLKTGPKSKGRFVRLKVPAWVRSSWEAGEPIEGLIDWLIETHGDEYPWLEENLRLAQTG